MHQPLFKIIPEGGELADIDRELGFFPSQTSSPRIISRDQVEQFNREGFLAPLPALKPEEMARQRDYFDRLLARVVAEGGDSYSISSAHLSYGRVYDLLTHPNIVAQVSDLLGENVIGWGSHYFCKMPHDGKGVSWHQDASYWPLTPSKTVTVWLAIDDVDQSNGCMRFIAGSHHYGHIPYRGSDSQEDNVLDQTVENAQQYGTAVEVPLAAGHISIHSDLLLHGSAANRSDRRRCGLTLRYCTPDVRAHLGWHQKGVVVQGQDTSGHWANPPRPEND